MEIGKRKSMKEGIEEIVEPVAEDVDVEEEMDIGEAEGQAVWVPLLYIIYNPIVLARPMVAEKDMKMFRPCLPPSTHFRRPAMMMKSKYSNRICVCLFSSTNKF